MRLGADAGAWTIGPPVAEAPTVAVLEVSGGVLEWTVDDPDGVAATRVTVTDVGAADWLWRVVGPDGHAAIVAGADRAEVELRATAFGPLRRLAVGHWLRRWWPESRRGGIPGLDRALLDGELAVLTQGAQEFFTEDTLDSDVVSLLAPHRLTLLALGRDGDPRVAGMARAAVDLADESGVWPDTETSVPVVDPGRGRRADYALAAGPEATRAAGPIAAGVGSLDWAAVPPATFDAAEDTVDWSVTVAGDPTPAAVVATVRVATTGGSSATGIEVRLTSGAVSATGVLAADGTATVPLLGGSGAPMTENQAWDHDWSTTTVVVGVNRRRASDPVAAQAVRQRIRDFARSRLARPGPDAFLAEVLAAESDY